jgi:hypothetical protein
MLDKDKDVMLEKDVLHKAAWDRFKWSLGSNRLQGDGQSATATKDSDAFILKFVKPTKLNITLPPPEERAPGFIIIGTQKGGTQALKTYLEQHPLIVMPAKTVEPHFFDWKWDEEKTPKENFQIYSKKYYDQDCRTRLCIAGESTPNYMYDRNVPARVHAVCPWMKMIVLLRDPVKRAQSHHNMLVAKNEINTKDFERRLQNELDWMKKVGLVSKTTLSHEEEDEAWIKYQDHRKWRKFMLGRGMYEIQLRAWFKYFPREQFLILKSEDLDHDRTATMSRVYQFLGVPEQVLENDEKVHMRKNSNPVSDEVQTFLYDFYRPYNRRLESLFGPEWKGIWERPSSSLEGTSTVANQRHQSK